MSWNFSFAAVGKAQARAEIDKIEARDRHNRNIPPHVIGFIRDACTSGSDDAIYIVDTHGHLSMTKEPNGSNAKIDVRVVEPTKAKT